MVSCCAAGGLGHGLRDAEVHHQRVPAGEQDVLRLDVAMDHARAWCAYCERVGDLAQQPQRLGDRELAARASSRSRSVSPSTYGIT